MILTNYDTNNDINYDSNYDTKISSPFFYRTKLLSSFIKTA